MPVVHIPPPAPMVLTSWPARLPPPARAAAAACPPGLVIATDPLPQLLRRTPTLVRPPRALICWLPPHVSPRRVLPLLHPQPCPTMLVTDHPHRARLLAPHCPSLRIICTPDRAETDFCTLLRLLPHLHGGPLVLPAGSGGREARDAA